MDALERLQHKAEIEVLKARYCRFLDTKQWDKLRALFTEDAWLEGYASVPQGGSLDMYMDGVVKMLGSVVGVHQCHTPEIVFRDETLARAVWAEQDFFETVETAADGSPFVRRVTGFGHYEEEYKRVDGTWRISFIRLVRTTMISDPPGHLSTATPRLTANLDWLDFDAAEDD